ncbi:MULTISPECIES: mandelate racemase/muconate lactonizing enzyme family protein [Microbacterium]|uniref:mandelate racemase/muconate lactonizing enzyme family protein n=1 Tax=Microbacterium TaxID=33882 RepID=UPI0010F633D9|nr:mandelate racemase/muconate lactonizing enzyme family protein [Microbacterium sp. 4NA327F11]MCK9913336.1 mandelate racemase/muconate lactonizing enzyme family protein [Microbacteriaceae bacterium K1510]
MKITDVTAAGLRGATPAGGWTQELQPEDSAHTLVFVTTDEGLTGIGSVFTTEPLVKASLLVLRDLLLGEDALDTERVTEKLHQNTFWFGRGGAITHTISGINIALWDIAGKAYGQPIGRLLGGAHRDRVRPYASLLMQNPEPLEAELLRLRGQGFTAFKIGWGPFGRVNATLDEAIVAAARNAVGDDTLLAVDAGGSDAYWHNGYKWALNTSKMLADYGVAWFEEALNPDDLAGFKKLREHSPVPISGGETLTRRQSFTPFLRAAAFDIVQPDVTKVGGLSESISIGKQASDLGIKLIPHGWNTAIGLAADLQIASALSNTDLIEYCTGSAYIDDLPATPWSLDAEGFLAIPDQPGLGVAWDTDAIHRLTGVPNLPIGSIRELA